jgi:Tfp pilus assembly protein PilN
VTLWALATILLGVNGWLYWRHFDGQGQQRSELSRLEASMAEERRLLSDAMVLLEGYDLDWQREQVTFLNARIAERTFSWSALFDHLAEVLPRGVRVERVTLTVGSRGRSRRGDRQRSADDEVTLQLTGVAEEDVALLVLLDAFFAHERFQRPNLSVEARNQSATQVSFSMNVVYRPAMPEADPPVDDDVEQPEEMSLSEAAVEVAS